MKYECRRCNGRGWFPPKRSDQFPEYCVCRGAPIRSAQIARMLKLHRRDVYDVENLRNACAGERVLDAIARVFPGELGITSIRARVANL